MKWIVALGMSIAVGVLSYASIRPTNPVAKV